MTESGKTSGGGISIRVIHVTMILCTVIIALLLGFSTYQSSNVFTTLSKTTGNYLVRQKAAHDLMEASDYLTEMVQRFTLEGDETYLNNYFEEAFVSKRREASIMAMSDNNADQSLIRQLQEAMEESQSLMYREYYAMKLVIEAKGIKDYPDTIRAIELNEKDVFLSEQEKMDLAQNMVMGSEYYVSKDLIRSRLKSSLETMDQQMSETQRDTSAQMMRDLTYARGILIVLFVVLLFLIAMTAYLSTIPLIRASRSIRKNESIPVSGAKEFRELASQYNSMQETLSPKDPD